MNSYPIGKIRAQNNNKQRGKKMKIKVKGLVFVGFAAAVFAQSALAEGENKIVTSKKYVDEKIVSTTGENHATNITDTSSDTKAPSALNVYKFVTGQVTGAAINVAGDSTYTTASYDTSTRTHTVSLNTGSLATTANLYALDTTNDGKLATAGAVKGLLDTTISGAETDTVVPTSKAVVDYAEKLANKKNSISSADSQDSTSYPTTGAVYNFVNGLSGNYQPHVDTTDTATLYVGHNAAGNVAEWNALEATVQSSAQATADYVKIASNGGVYDVNLASSMIATDSATLASAATDSTTDSATMQAKLTTAKAVYDFVSGGYQPKTTGTTVKVGYDGNWRELTVDPTYMTLNTTTGAAVGLTNLTSATTDVDSSAGTKLVTSGVLYQLLGGLAIPEPGSDCQAGANGITSDNGVACALVLAYHDDAVGLKWIPMAQTAQ